MALIIKDRISETTSTTGTGTLSLSGAVPGFQAFSVIGDTNTTYYCITDGVAWEVGLGTYSSSGNTFARTTIYATSNGNTTPITLTVGSKSVFSCLPADGIVTVNGSIIQVPQSAVLPVANGGTGSSTATFSGANITSLNASNISSGTIANARTTASDANGASTIVARDASGNFSANVITANGSAITSLNASSISSGTLDNARTSASSANGANTIVLRDASGDFAADIITANSFSGSGASITSINASNISTGTIANARTTATHVNGASTIVARDASGNFAGATITGTAFSGDGASITGINGSNISSGTVANARTTASSSNGASTIVARDASGNFSANTITATITGTASALVTGNSYQVGSLGVGTAASGTTGEIRATNNVTAYYSDDRLKTKLSGIESALEKLCSLSGFFYKANETAQALGYDAIKEVGLSAQEVQKVLPEVVVPAPIDAQYLTIRYERLAPLIVEAIKELKAEVDKLKAK